MSLIRRPDQIEVQTKIKMLIYGQPSTGKTTLALSAPKPLLLDFDGGVSRLNEAHRGATAQLKNWEECVSVMKEDLSAYETIVVDTIGKMLDYIITYVCKGRTPSIKDWGPINGAFTSFVRQLNSLDKNIIFVAHRDNRKEGDNNVFVPAIREKSYNAIVTELDLMGYIESRNNERVITFDFSDRNDGKNTCNLPQFITIPSIVDASGKATGSNDFVQRVIIAPFVGRLQAQAEATAKTHKAVSEIKEQIEVVTDEASANDFMKRVLLDKDYPHFGTSSAAARAMFAEKVKELGLSYNEKTKKYEHAA